MWLPLSICDELWGKPWYGRLIVIALHQTAMEDHPYQWRAKWIVMNEGHIESQSFNDESAHSNPYFCKGSASLVERHILSTNLCGCERRPGAWVSPIPSRCNAFAAESIFWLDGNSASTITKRPACRRYLPCWHTQLELRDLAFRAGDWLSGLESRRRNRRLEYQCRLKRATLLSKDSKHIQSSRLI